MPDFHFAAFGIAVAALSDVAAATQDLTQYTLAVYSDRRFGSGVAVSENHIATSSHTLQGASTVGVTNRDASIRVATDKGVGSGEKDVCLLHFDKPHGFPVPTIGASRMIQPGQRAAAMGYAGGQLTVVRGSVLGKKELEHGRWIIHTDTPVTAGSSGGPLFDENGLLVGIVTYIQLDKYGTHLGCFSVPVEWAVELTRVSPYATWSLYQGGEFWRPPR